MGHSGTVQLLRCGEKVLEGEEESYDLIFSSYCFLFFFISWCWLVRSEGGQSFLRCLSQSKSLHVGALTACTFAHLFPISPWKSAVSLLLFWFYGCLALLLCRLHQDPAGFLLCHWGAIPISCEIHQTVEQFVIRRHLWRKTERISSVSKCRTPPLHCNIYLCIFLPNELMDQTEICLEKNQKYILWNSNCTGFNLIKKFKFSRNDWQFFNRIKITFLF